MIQLINIIIHTIAQLKLNLKPSKYVESSKEINYQDPKCKIGDIVIISKYKSIFARGYAPSWSEEVFMIKKVKNTVPWTYIISALKDEEIVGTLQKRIIKKQSKRVQS